jgi:hypothetical protein
MTDSCDPALGQQAGYVDVEELMAEYKCPRCGHETDEWTDLFCDGCKTGIISSFDAQWLAGVPDYNNKFERVVR